MSFDKRWISRGGPVTLIGFKQSAFLSMGTLKAAMYETLTESEINQISRITSAVPDIRENPVVFD